MAMEGRSWSSSLPSMRFRLVISVLLLAVFVIISCVYLSSMVNIISKNHPENFILPFLPLHSNDDDKSVSVSVFPNDGGSGGGGSTLTTTHNNNNNNNNNRSSIETIANMTPPPTTTRGDGGGGGGFQQYNQEDVLLAWNNLSLNATQQLLNVVVVGGVQRNYNNNNHHHHHHHHHNPPSSSSGSSSSSTTSSSSSSSTSITAAVHLSMNKFNRFSILNHRWNGPLSVSIYICDVTDIYTFFTVIQEHYFYHHHHHQENQNENKNHHHHHHSIRFHILLEKIPYYYYNTPVDNNSIIIIPDEFKYPHNILRQMAIDTITESDYVLLLDVDFVTQPNAYDQLCQLLFGVGVTNNNNNNNNNNDLNDTTTTTLQRLQNQLIVLPAFETITSPSPNTVLQKQEQKKTRKKKTIIQNRSNVVENITKLEESLPATRNEVKSMIEKEQLVPFHMINFNIGHGPTNFTKWLMKEEEEEEGDTTTATTNHNHNNTLDSSSSSYYYPIPYAEQFEPYVIGYIKNLPKFWSGFRGFGINKWSFFLELYYMRNTTVEFIVLYDFFVIHIEHGGLSSEKKRGTPNQYIKNQFHQFQKYLKKTYPTNYNNKGPPPKTIRRTRRWMMEKNNWR